MATTGMASYDMKPFVPSLPPAYFARVDCDLENGTVYRATGTCHVAVLESQNGKTFYSHFVLHDHAQRKHGVSVAAIRLLWTQLIVASQDCAAIAHATDSQGKRTTCAR